jgi:hypothetical protein
MTIPYLCMAMPLGPLMRMTLRNGGIGLQPRYLLRFALLLQGAVWSSLLAARENKAYAARLAAAEAPRDPIIIISHWRTGSTLLHQLLSRDPQFIAPTYLQCCYPGSFLGAEKILTAVMRRLMQKQRPMDNVLVDPAAPQEEDFALFRMTGRSAVERLIFPRPGQRFLLDDPLFLAAPGEPPIQERALLAFVKKIGMRQPGRRIVLKNPLSAVCIESLARLFPQSQFIHIYRDPRAVIPSTMHLWRVLLRDNALRGPLKEPTLDETITVFDTVMHRIDAALATLPPQRQCAVRFEDFELNPKAELGALYAGCGFAWTAETEAGVNAFMAAHAGYRKNAYTLSGADRRIIEERLSHIFSRYGYRS